MDITNLKSWLPFNESATADKLGNIWKASGTPTIENGELILDGSSKLISPEIELGGKDFAIDAWIDMNTSSSDGAEVFYVGNNSGYMVIVTRSSDKLVLWTNKNATVTNTAGYNTTTSIVGVGQRVHVELDYSYSAKTTTLYINGTQAAQRTGCPQFTRGQFKIWLGDSGFTGTIDEFRLYDGTTLHTANFTPPTAEEYVINSPLELSCDVLCKVRNADLTWRYENAGTADSLIVSGTTLTDLPATKSVTGTAFYQTAREKCFDIPTTGDIWIKFDLYHYSGTSRFRIYDDKNGSTANGFVLTQNSSTQVALWSWNGSANGERKTFDGILKADTLQTWLLHMSTGTTDGLLELWCDDNFCGSWTGNVNNGEDFANVFLQTDDANNIFSNVIISNAQIGLGEGWHVINADVKVKVKQPDQTWRYYLTGGWDYNLILPEATDEGYEPLGSYSAEETEKLLSAGMSKTGEAFTQRQQAKCFDVPATHEVWIKFDVYFDGEHRWRAYNGGSNGVTGITAQINGDLSFFANGTNVYQTAGICKTNQLQTVLLHMVAGRSDGIIEAWVDGSRIYTYIGNVNYDSDFEDIYLQCDCEVYSSGYSLTSDYDLTVFSNFMISNAEIELDDGWHELSFDTERALRQNFFFDVEREIVNNGIVTELNLDIERNVANPNYHEISFDVERKKAALINISADTQRKLKNVVTLNSVDIVRNVTSIWQAWKYYNYGTADDLLVEAKALTDLPETQSITGVALRGGAAKAMFPIPASDELWIKFDAYGDFLVLNNPPGIYDYCYFSVEGLGVRPKALVGIVNAQTLNDDYTFEEVQLLTSTFFHTYLVHIKSSVENGVIEAWYDGKFLKSFTGPLNRGEPLSDLYFSSNGALFSNILIANTPIGFEEGFTEISFDVERNLVPPIFIPPIEEHFNHFISSFKIYSDRLQRIVLPWDSQVFFRAKSAGIIKLTSDTDRVGTSSGSDFFKTGEIYTSLGRSKILTITIDENNYTPQQVIKAFIKSLDETNSSGTAAVDAAVNFATNGAFATTAALVDKFFSDLDASSSYTDFLQTCCDIILDNVDTGAITGWDVGGSTVKTDSSVVPEPLPVNQWVTPSRGSSSTICGLTVHFPKRGASGSLTVEENHILAGLNSVWIEQALKLIEQSFRIDFNDADISVHDINVKFENKTKNAIAYVKPTYSDDGKTTALELYINMHYFNDIDTTDVNGALKTSSPLYYAAGYLDRTLAHELTHAVMAANIDNFADLPLFIQEGTAELVHGIDDVRRNVIQELLTTRRADLQNVFSSGGSDADAYAAGYMLLRYLAKQGQSSVNVFAPYELELTDVLISDGATDSDYEALTDNTRQIFDADIAIMTVHRISDGFDFERILFSSPDFLVDVQRNLIAQVNLFARDRETFFHPDDPPSQPIDLPVDTKGVQAFEVSLAEQQLTDQVKFTAVIPFDIMQEVRGQYLDYKYNMIVERVQQQGILYTCDCCSDVDKLLYTQIAYKIPPVTSWTKIDGEQIGGSPKTVEIQTVYPSAYTHANAIAHALGLTPVIQFNDFLSTVLMDEKGGVTYNDLIRDIFGWSSRIPTMLINVYIRDGKLYFVQRGKETNTVDITNAKHTEPVITRELVRTTWGSSVDSTTHIIECDVNLMTYTPDTIVGGDEGDEDEKFFIVKDTAEGKNWHATTIYEYSKGNEWLSTGGRMQAGLLVRVEINKHYNYGSGKADSYTQILHDYDKDGTRIGTETYVHYLPGEVDTPRNTRNINRLGYITLPNGEKYLARESTERYEDGNLIDSTITTHSPSKLGQTHVTTITDDGIAGGVTGQNTGDDRVTPYRLKQVQASAAEMITAGTGTWTETTQHHETGTTVYGTLIKVTKALKDLNRKTKETVNLTVYDLEHLIDFNDKITFNGSTYHLASNTARTTARILFEQNLSLVRWY